jgi:tryptophanyl-tRNA synthetase
MAKQLQTGGYGWGHAKKDLLQALVDGFADERARFHELMADKAQIDKALSKGAEKARAVATAVLARVHERAGY